MSFRTRLEYGVYQTGRFLMWAYLRTAHGLMARGLEHFPRSGGVLVVGNHPSLFDPAAIIVTAPRPVRFMAAEVLFKVPVLRRYLRGAGMIRVDRKSGGHSAFRQALRALQNGEAVGIFPHGELVKEYEQRIPRNGAVQLALRAGVPLLPVYCEGTEKSYPRSALLPRPLCQIGLVYGEPFTVSAGREALKDDEAMAAASREVLDRIFALKGQAKQLTQAAVYKPIAPFEHLLREADRHPEIWEHQSRVR